MMKIKSSTKKNKHLFILSKKENVDDEVYVDIAYSKDIDSLTEYAKKDHSSDEPSNVYKIYEAKFDKKLNVYVKDTLLVYKFYIIDVGDVNADESYAYLKQLREQLLRISEVASASKEK